MTSYSITVLGQPRAKKRLRMLLSIAGMEQIRIVEKEADPQSPRPKPDNLPTSAEARAVADLFGRRHDTPWADKEITAFKKAAKTGTITLENMKLIARYYDGERRKGDVGRHRRDLFTFLNNASGELDRAGAVKPCNGKALQWAAAPNIVPMLPPEEEERIRREAKAGAAQLKARLARTE